MWKRPENIPIPTVWSEFQGRVEVNGEKRNYWIQDYTEDYHDEVISALKINFIGGEPLCYLSDFGKDRESVDSFVEIWERLLQQQVSLICLTQGSDGKPELAGMNINYASIKGGVDYMKTAKGRLFIMCINLMRLISNKVDVYKELDIDRYLSSTSLSVLPKFRGENIGCELLKARGPLAKAMGFKVTAAVFSSKFSQACAAKAGFKELSQLPYEEIEKMPEYTFPGISKHTDYLKYMYNMFE